MKLKATLENNTLTLTDDLDFVVLRVSSETPLTIEEADPVHIQEINGTRNVKRVEAGQVVTGVTIDRIG